MSLPNPVASPSRTPSWAPPVSPLTPPSEPLRGVGAETAASLLFDSRQEAEAAVDGAADKIKPSAGQRKLSEIARKVAKREIRRAIIELLDIKVGDVVLKAWHRHGALLAAAQRTTTGGREVVLLADHTITSNHSPDVELAVNGVEIGTITSKIAMSLQLVGVNAVVQRGELVTIEGGSIVASAKLSIEDVPVASRSRTVDAVAVIHLTTPIPLASSAPAPNPQH